METEMETNTRKHIRNQNIRKWKLSRWKQIWNRNGNKMFPLVKHCSAISSYNDTNISSCEVKKTTSQSFVLVGRRTYLIHYVYAPQEVIISSTFWEFYDFIYGSFSFSLILTMETRFCRISLNILVKKWICFTKYFNKCSIKTQIFPQIFLKILLEPR